MKNYKQIKERLEYVLENNLNEDEHFDINDFEEEILGIEEQVNEDLEISRIYHSRGSFEENKLKHLLKLIKRIKSDYNFYDEEYELDRMFPNRHDDDFDEDSMTYESVFGKD